MLAGIPIDVETQLRAIDADGEPADDTDLAVPAIAVFDHRRLAARRPLLPDAGDHRESRFIHENQRAFAFSAGPLDRRPFDGAPLLDPRLVAFLGAHHRLLIRVAQFVHDGADVIVVIAHAELLFDQPRHQLRRPQVRAVAVMRRRLSEQRQQLLLLLIGEFALGAGVRLGGERLDAARFVLPSPLSHRLRIDVDDLSDVAGFKVLLEHSAGDPSPFFEHLWAAFLAHAAFMP